MKDGKALCTKCGREPEKREIPSKNNEKESKNSLKNTLERKLEALSKELEQEMNHDKQQNILKSINSVLEMIEKIK